MLTAQRRLPARIVTAIAIAIAAAHGPRPILFIETHQGLTTGLADPSRSALSGVPCKDAYALSHMLSYDEDMRE